MRASQRLPLNCETLPAGYWPTRGLSEWPFNCRSASFTLDCQREAATSILVYAEIVEYFKSLPRFEQHHAELRQLLHVVHPYFPTYGILERYADIRRALRPPHGPGLIGDIDTLIAATALERELTIVTTDHDFDRVPALSSMIVSVRN